MNPGYAAAVIRFVIANHIKEKSIKDGHGTLWRKWHGQTRTAINKKKVVIAQSNMGMVPASDDYKKDAFVCFWVLMNKPITSEDIFIQQGSGIAKTFLGAAVGSIAGSGSLGTTIQSVQNIKSTKDDIFDFAGKVRSGISGGSGILAGLNTAWRAGMWDSVLGTSNEFSFAVDEGLFFGCAAISGPLNKWTIDIRKFDDKREMMALMSAAEQKGLRTPAALKLIRSISKGGSIHQSYNTKMTSN